MRDHHQLKFFSNPEAAVRRAPPKSHATPQKSRSKSPDLRAGASQFRRPATISQSPPPQQPGARPPPVAGGGADVSAEEGGDRRLHIRVAQPAFGSAEAIAVPSAPPYEGKELDYQELCHIAWNAFDLMMDAQRNAFLKGLLL
ncbi:MAG: hypothetical protein BJ554DRAFT_4790, partial [Olpidium bornovanus]